MKTVILIPARYASTRYPGKQLVEVTQPDGRCKSLIRMSWDAANRVTGVAEVHVVTDDERIRTTAQGFGASVIMTSPECENGTARCAEALSSGQLEADLVVNLQGDAPLTPPWFVEDLIAAMVEDQEAKVATPVLRCDAQTYRHFIEDRKAGRVGGTTTIFDTRGMRCTSRKRYCRTSTRRRFRTGTYRSTTTSASMPIARRRCAPMAGGR